MATLKHKKVSVVPDGPNAALVRPSDWNDAHDIPASGILVGDASTDDLAGIAAGSPLQFLRRTNVTTVVGYEFVSQPVLQSTDFNWSQTIQTTLSAGATSVTLSPVPLGVNGSNTDHYIRFGGSSPETRLITGGTAVSGAASGTLTFAALSNTHTGPFPVTSATAGIQEAVYYTAPGNVSVPAGAHTLYAKLTLTGRGGSDLNVFGAGTIASRLVRHSSYASGDLVVASTVIAEGRINLSDFAIYNAVGFENPSGTGLDLIGTQIDSIFCERVEVINGYNPISYTGSTSSSLAVMKDCRAIIQAAYSAAYTVGNAIEVDGSAYLIDTVGIVQSAGSGDGSGLYIKSCDGLNVLGGSYNGRFGVHIANDPAKTLNFLYLNGLIIDATYSHGVFVDAGSHNAAYSQLRVQDCHFASQSGDSNAIGVYVANDLQSVVVTGCNISGFANAGVVMGNMGVIPKGFVISNNAINNCGNFGIVVGSSSTDAIGSITGNQCGNAIDIYGPATQDVGIYFSGASNGFKKVVVTGNNLHGNITAPLVFDAGPTNGVVWTANSGVDDVVTANVASAASIDLPVYPIFGLTGTTGVGAVTGPLCEGHQWTMIPNGIVTFTAGATIGNTFTTAANVPVQLTVYGGKVYLK